ncbi:hypothetical protein FRC09_010851 [Ceratobasidium sp. 395]|nr:hypothetical protein FRC09_010851 [Ceratobasidium sp. 395]
MGLVDFSNLPLNVARGVLIDTIAKFLDIPRSVVLAGRQPFIVNLEAPGTLSTGIKNKDGTGSIKFHDKTLLQIFLAKLKTESIMFESQAVQFSCQDNSSINSPRPPSASESSSHHKAKRAPRATPTVTVARSHTSSARSSAPTMNLHGSKQRYRRERRRHGSNNAHHMRKLQHRMSELGQQARLKRIQFGVLRNLDFSVEYTRELSETAGYLSFEDDQKTLRIIVGGTHQVGNSLVPSVAIAIQTINYVALGDDGEDDYMFLELLQHPRFEQADQFRSTSGDSRKDAQYSRDRLSELDESHGRIAPYASRWLKILFHEDSEFIPDEHICHMAKLPLPDLNPQLTFDDERQAYSANNIELLEDWLRGGSLPWEVVFQCEALFRNGILVPREVLMLRSRVESLAEQSPSQACDILISLRTDLEGASAPKRLSKFEDEEVVAMFDYHLAESEKKAPLSRLRDGSSRSNFLCHHVKITPTGIFLAGLVIGDRRYTLLGYSQSGMRDHACLFSSRFVFEGSEITPASIRSSLGDFTKVIDCPARYGARMSQAFSSTDPSIVIPRPCIKPIVDIKTEKGDFEFSDGCGTISRDLAKKAWQSMLDQMPHSRRRRRHKDEPIPSAFQIRIGGSKGMVRMDPKLLGDQLCLRPSMTKFEAPGELTLEIARAFERPSDCFLNRPLIMLLWTNGVDSSVFEKMMKQTLESTFAAMKTFAGVAKLLINNKLGRSFRLANTFAKLSLLKLEPDQAGVRTVALHRLLNTALYHIKILLKHKARIPVPGSHTLVGVCDEDDYLKPRQIYACVQRFDHKTGKIDREYLKGRLLVTRSPYIHPGDAQILYGIGAPPPDSPFAGEDNHLPNCVVFSTRGLRPVPNMLGGGDLGLIQPNSPTRTHPAAQVHARQVPTSYVEQDIQGKAVDFMKTGIHVPPDDIRKPKYDKYRHPETGLGLRPDWQAGHARGRSDAHVLGQLFRAVQLPQGDPTRETVEALPAPKAIQQVLAAYVAKYTVDIKGTFVKATPWVQALLSRYTSELSHICVSHTISSESTERVSELEVMLGTNLETAYESSNLIERMKRLTENLASFVRSELQGDEGSSPYDWLARAWRAYLLTSNLGDEKFGAFSFSWIALGSVFEALNKLDECFLPDDNLIIPPFPGEIAASESIRADLEEFAAVDMDNWVWDDETKTKSKDGGGSHKYKGGFRRRGGQNTRADK